MFTESWKIAAFVIGASLAVAAFIGACTGMVSEPVKENPSGEREQQVGAEEVAFDVENSVMFTHAYQDIGVTIGSDISCTFEELTIESTGPYNTISRSKDETFDRDNPEVRLLAAGTPGQYSVEASCSGTKVGSESYEISKAVSAGDKGPSTWIGSKTSAPRTAQSGDLVDEVHDDPNVNDVKDPRKTLAIMIETDGSKWGNDFSDRRTYWKEILETGHQDSKPYEGVFSANQHFSELSGGISGIDVDIPSFPVQLPTSLDAVMREEEQLDPVWGKNDKYGNRQKIINEFEEADLEDDGVRDYNILDYNVVMFIFRDNKVATTERTGSASSEDDPDTQCDGIDNDGDGDVDEQDDIGSCGSSDECGNGWVDDTVDENGDYVEECDDGNLKQYDRCKNDCTLDDDGIAGPNAQKNWVSLKNWKGNADGTALIVAGDRYGQSRAEQMHATMVHEFGHAFSWGYDLYDGANFDSDRILEHHSFMSVARRHPHASAKFRVEQNWIEDQNVFTIDPREQNGGISRTFRLRAIESMNAPDSDSYLTGQVFLSQDHLLHLSYRLGQYEQIGDRLNPFDQEVDGGTGYIVPTEYDRDPNNPDSNKGDWVQQIVFPVDTDGNAVKELREGETYTQDLAGTSAGPQMDITVDDITQTSSNRHEAQVTVTVDELEADPNIRPWQGAASGWKSPDIMIENARTKDGSPNEEQWDEFNQPLPGEDNELVGRVWNDGEKKATDVEVNFEVKKLNASEDKQTTVFKKTAGPKDVPLTTNGGKPTLFSVEWGKDKVPESGHYCIRAIVDGGAQDMNPGNNEARSNHKGDWSGSASPAKRRTTEVEVNNPYNQEVVYGLDLNQTHNHFRAYLEHRWVTVPAGGMRKVEVQYEYSGDFHSRYQEDQTYRPKNLVSVESHHVVPGSQGDHFERESGEISTVGAQIRVFAGYSTQMEVEPFEEESEYIQAYVARERDGSGVREGEVLVIVERSDGSTDTYRDTTDDPGEFVVPVDLTNWSTVDVQYLGLYPDNPSDMQTFERQ